MPIITLTTDWNNDDFYIASVKGAIHSYCSNAIIVDITHKIKTFNIFHAAFILKNSYKLFPEGTIHIIGVNTDGNSEQAFLATEYDGHFFIGTDNGIFSLLFDSAPTKIVAIENLISTSFAVIEVFIKVASELINGTDIESLGTKTEQFVRRTPLLATIEESTIIGSIVYIDSYQNAITNISKEIFEQVGKNRQFKIYVQSNGNVISKINKKYGETSPGELLALFNSINLLEIAIFNGNAAELLGLDTNSTVRIKFSK